jgi:hypothetical protein
MATGRVIRTRVAVNATCNELLRIAQGMAAFGALADAARAGIAQASGALDGLLDYLGVPLGVEPESREGDREGAQKRNDDARSGEL